MSNKPADRPPSIRAPLLRSSAIMASGTFSSRALGFLKGIIVAYALGALGPLSAIYETANTLPNILYLMLGGGFINALLIPQIIKASKSADRGADYISRLLTMSLSVMLIVTVIVTACSGPLMQLLTQFEGPELALATHFGYWLLPQIFFYAAYVIIGQILTAHERFGASMWAPVLNNLVTIGGIAVYITFWGSAKANPRTLESWTETQTATLGVFTTAGIVLQALILLFPLRNLHLKIRFRWGLRDSGMATTARLAVWGVLLVIINQSAYLTMTWAGTMATSTQENQNSVGIFIFNRANDIIFLPQAVFAVSIMTVFFNRISHRVSENDSKGVKVEVSRMLRTVGVVIVICMALLIILAGQIGLIMTGEDHFAASRLALAIIILTLGLPFLSAGIMLSRVLFAYEDMKALFSVQLVGALVGAGGALLGSILIPPEAIIYYLLVILTVAEPLATILYIQILRRKIGPFGLKTIAYAYAKFFLAAAVAMGAGLVTLWALGGLAVFAGRFDTFAWQSVPTVLLTTVAVATTMLVAYVLTLAALRSEELREMMPILERFAPRLTHRIWPHRLGSNNKSTSKQTLKCRQQSAVATGPIDGGPLTDPVSVGSILGRRYTVTEHVLTSAEGDHIYVGLDDVLQRPVSVVIPSEENTQALSEGSRELATGARQAPFQILDIGTDEGATYLITSRANAADLLELIIPTEPYIEPTPTDALSAELFGSLRPSDSTPGPYDYVYEDNTPVDESLLPKPLEEEDEEEPEPITAERPLVEHQLSPGASTVASSSSEQPPVHNERVSLLDEPRSPSSHYLPATTGDILAQPAPVSAEPEFDDDENTPRSSGRLLLLTALGAAVVVVLILGFNQWSRFFAPPPPPTAPSASTTSSATSTPTSTPTTVPPTPAAVTRLVSGGDGSLSSATDNQLGNLIDGSPGTTWQSLQFGSPNFGNFAKSLALAIELQKPANVTSVSIQQAGTVGGSFEVLAADSPDLTGAKSIGVGSFTSPEITVATSGAAQKAQSIIINFTELPRLQPNALPRLPYGLKISEIVLK